MVVLHCTNLPNLRTPQNFGYILHGWVNNNCPTQGMTTFKNEAKDSWKKKRKNTTISKSITILQKTGALREENRLQVLRTDYISGL